MPAMPEQRQHVPTLEACEQPRLHVRMRGQEIVQARGECVAELTRAGTKSLVFGPRQRRHLQGSIQPVLCDLGPAVGLGGAAKRVDVTVFQLRKVVFCLCIGETKDRARIRRAVDIGHPMTIPVDCHCPSHSRGGVDRGGPARYNLSRPIARLRGRISAPAAWLTFYFPLSQTSRRRLCCSLASDRISSAHTSLDMAPSVTVIGRSSLRRHAKTVTVSRRIVVYHNVDVKPGVPCRNRVKTRQAASQAARRRCSAGIRRAPDRAPRLAACPRHALRGGPVAD